MNPKHLSVRMDRVSGDLWLTEEKYKKPIKRVANITAHVLLALCADLMAEEGTEEVTRDVRFNDGSQVQIVIKPVPSTTD